MQDGTSRGGYGSVLFVLAMLLDVLFKKREADYTAFGGR
jgi:hypothetical protein